MDYQSLLNERQYEAVSTASQYVRIVAGAGSGKTRVLTYRIAFLISEMQVNPRSILAIAFTNKVAKEMKERACKLVPDASPVLSISTFHSFCAKFLRMEASLIGFPSNFTIYDEDDQQKLIKSIAEEWGYRKKDDIVSQSLDYIRENKCAGRYPDDINIKSERIESLKECYKFFVAYEEKKNAMYGMDFDDLLIRTIKILENFPETRIKWQKRIDHILIDEFQDTNDVQFKLVKLLLKPTTCLYVVGDPDQTIYTWRGANQKIILDFEKTFSDVDTIILDRNYRSTQTILDTANKLIARNKKRVKKNLYTENSKGSGIVLYKGYTKDLEAEWVIRNIEKLIREDNVSYSDIALLYRSSYITLPFERELTKKQIPYRVFGGLRFYQRKEIKDVLAYVRLIFNPLDDVSFERIINTPRRGIGDVSIDKLRSEKESHRLSFYNYVLHLDEFETSLSSKTVIALTSMVKKMNSYKEKFKDNLELYSKVIEEMITDLGYMDYLALEDDGDDRLENVKALFSDMYDYIKKNPESTFEEYLQNVSLATSQDDMNDGDYVSLMTIHIAKGLEFPYVFVVGMQEGVFPSIRTMDESGNDGLEEERRLCYVAFTRAKEKLYLSCNTDYSFTLQGRPIPSRFFMESELKFVNDSPFTRQYGPSLDHRNNPYMNDDSFEQTETKPVVQENGISDWSIGDVIIHSNFGEGVVTKVIDNGTVIEVMFDSCGKKTLLSKHPMISRKEHVGGKA